MTELIFSSLSQPHYCKALLFLFIVLKVLKLPQLNFVDTDLDAILLAYIQHLTSCHGLFFFLNNVDHPLNEQERKGRQE